MARRLEPNFLPHFLFDPQREADLLRLPNQHVDRSGADHTRQHARQASAVAELVAVLLSHHGLEKISANELLGDRRSALRKDCGVIRDVPLSHSRQAAHQIAEPDLAQHARKGPVVNTGMGEEVLVFCGDDGVADNRRDLFVAGDLAGLGCHLLEWLAVGIVDVSDGRKLKPGESTQIRQIVAIKVKVVKTGGGEKARERCVANEQTNQAALPMDPPQPRPRTFEPRRGRALADAEIRSERTSRRTIVEVVSRCSSGGHFRRPVHRGDAGLGVSAFRRIDRPCVGRNAAIPAVVNSLLETKSL